MILIRSAFILVIALGLTACQTHTPRITPPIETTEIIAPTPSLPLVIEPPYSVLEDSAEQILSAPELPRYESAADVLQRLRNNLTEPPCLADERVRHWQQRYAGSPQRFANQVNAILPWMRMTLDELERLKLPGEFALLPIVESWYRPDARGAGDHVGLWQLGRSTAQHLDVPMSQGYDGRLSANASTEAALTYLSRLQEEFGDWKLAIAAFNAGPYRVKKILENHSSPEFSTIARQPSGLPASTFEHIAKMKALACLLGEPERFGIPVQADNVIDPLVAITLPPGQSSLAAIAKDLDISSNVLSTLNPAFRQGFIAKDSPRDLLIPQSLTDRFDTYTLPHAVAPKLTATTSTPPSNTKTYTVRRGDTLSSIAKRHGIKLSTLYQLNGLNANSILRIGARLRLAR